MSSTVRLRKVGFNGERRLSTCIPLYSNGHYEIAELESQWRIDVLVLTDSFLGTVIYGVWHLDRIGLSVRDLGAANYLAAIHNAQGRFPDVILVPVACHVADILHDMTC